MMIEIRHNDSRNTAGADKFNQRFTPQRNWIDKIATIGCHEASRVKVRFNGEIITVPNAEIRSDSVEIERCSPRARPSALSADRSSSPTRMAHNTMTLRQ